jgi:hypothetical protein
MLKRCLRHVSLALLFLGIVADQTKAIVVGAKITIRNSDTGLLTSQVSDSAGQYVFPSVLPGTYKLTAQLAGFKTWNRTIVLHANDHLSVDVPMTVGDIATSVTVTATTEQMDSGQRSETLTSAQIQALSTISRNAEELLPLLPGVVENGSTAYGQGFGGNGVTSGSNGIEGFNVNGNRSDANTFKLDGGNMDDLTGNNGSNIYPNSEFGNHRRNQQLHSRSGRIAGVDHRDHKIRHPGFPRRGLLHWTQRDVRWE